jgi:hypothetical protein
MKAWEHIPKFEPVPRRQGRAAVSRPGAEAWGGDNDDQRFCIACFFGLCAVRLQFQHTLGLFCRRSFFRLPLISMPGATSEAAAVAERDPLDEQE